MLKVYYGNEYNLQSMSINKLKITLSGRKKSLKIISAYSLKERQDMKYRKINNQIQGPGNGITQQPG